MISKDLAKKTHKELTKMVEDHKKSIEKLVGDVYKGKEKNVAKIRSMKKEVARMKTQLSTASQKGTENA